MGHLVTHDVSSYVLCSFENRLAPDVYLTNGASTCFELRRPRKSSAAQMAGYQKKRSVFFSGSLKRRALFLG